MQAVVVAVFALTYLGMAAGKIPGLRLDRTGMVLLASVALLLAFPSLRSRAATAIDVGTLLVLGSLMLVSAQLELSGFYDRAAFRLARAEVSPRTLLLVVVLAVGGLSALLTNDVVVFALTPMLIAGLRSRGLDSRPYLLATACAANAGSAATIIGNPQNVLIAERGHIGFAAFFAVCALPALASLGVVFVVVAWLFDGALELPSSDDVQVPSPDAPRLEVSAIAKGLVALAVMIGLFLSPSHDVAFVVFVALLLLVSRRRHTRELLDRVDWPMLLLFVGLFLVTDALVSTGLPQQGFAALVARGFDPGRLRVLLPLSLVGSNTIGNVPLVVLLLPIWKGASTSTLAGLSLLATLAGNFLLVGSVANLIVVERATAAGIVIGFREHARVGVPVALVSLAIACGWLWALGALPF